MYIIIYICLLYESDSTDKLDPQLLKELNYLNVNHTQNHRITSRNSRFMPYRLFIIHVLTNMCVWFNYR